MAKQSLVATAAGLGFQGQGGLVQGLGAFQLLFGSTGLDISQCHGQAGLAGLIQPVLQIRRLRGGKTQRLAQARQRVITLQRQRSQLVLSHLQGIFSLQDASPGQVQAGFGFVGIGNRGATQLKVLISSTQLLVNGGLLGFQGRQRILRSQHIKIALADAQHQILPIQRQLNIRALRQQLGAFVTGPGITVVHGLAQRQGPGSSVTGMLIGQLAGLTTLLQFGCADGADLWQQLCPALGYLFLIGLMRSLRSAKLRFMCQGLVPGLQQILRLGGAT